MTHGEMRLQIKHLTIKFESDKKDIIRTYLNSINPYKVGDIISDHIGKLQIEEWKYRTLESEPDLVYYGTELKKDGSPMKKQTQRAVYLSNVLKS
jgi:hypothetical protein